MDEFKPPARRAMAILDTPEPDSVPAPKRRVSRKLIAAIDAMVMGECKDVTQAAAKVGMARESVSRALRKPHVSQLLRSKTRQRLDTAAARAGAVKVELLDSSNEMVRDRASDFVLALAGIAPAKDPAVAVNVNIKAGYIIDLSEPHEWSPLRIVSNE
jgi:hypothetical protein